MSRLQKWLDYSLNAFYPGDAARLHVLLVSIFCIVVIGTLSLLALRRGRQRSLSRRRRTLAILGAAPLLLGFVSFLEAVLVEPRWLETTHQTVQTERLPAGKHLRIALLSDLHVSGWNSLLRELPARVNAEQPDLILYAGDSVNAPPGLAVFRSVLLSMHSTVGTYSVRGNHDLDLPEQGAELFSGGVSSELLGRPVTVANGQVVLCGAPWRQKGASLRGCLEQASNQAVRIALYHSPDLVEDVVLGGADLFFAGHTHGGQFRLPFYGAVITMSAYEKKYESGRYLVGDTTMYVNRGIGVEGRVIPLRFFCRPELTVIDLEGTGPAPETAPPSDQAASR